MVKSVATAFLLWCLIAAPAAAQDSFGGNTSQDQTQSQDPAAQPSLPSTGQTQGGTGRSGIGQDNTGQGGTGRDGTGQGGTGQIGAGQGQADPLTQSETQDFGVAPVDTLHNGPMHGPTPASIPGGQIITTKGLVALFQNQQVPFAVLDILGGPEVIPNAIPAVPAHQPGHFNDQIQQQFGSFLQQITGGQNDMALVFYCQSPHCWMSYNAALRAIHLGYRNVLWYRGGIEAWKQGGQQTVSQNH